MWYHIWNWISNNKVSISQKPLLIEYQVHGWMGLRLDACHTIGKIWRIIINRRQYLSMIYCPDNRQHKITTKSKISSYSTRKKQDLHLLNLRLECTKKSFTEAQLEWDPLTVQRPPLSRLFQKIETAREGCQTIYCHKEAMILWLMLPA